MSVSPIVDAADIGTYLGITEVDSVTESRLEYIVGLAQSLCESVVSPLPAGAESVIVDVVVRAFSNPTNAQSEGMGPFNVNWGTVAGGLWLTSRNVSTLRRLNGGGGAFMIDTMPASARVATAAFDPTGYPLWDSAAQQAVDYGDWP